jgi:drug/metabolite transporter (DMT)-like permease
MPLTRIAPGMFVLLWATGFIGARYAMPWTGPFLFLFARFAITFAILAAIILFSHRNFPDFNTSINAMFTGCLIHGVYLGGVFWAIKNGMPAGLSALIVGLQPIITAILAGIFLGEKVSPRQWAGLAAGLVGVTLVLAPAWMHLTGRVTLATIFASAIAVIAMSAGTIWQKRFLVNAALLPATAMQFLGAAVFVGILSALIETPAVVWSAELVFAMAWLVLVLSIGAIFLLMVLIREGEVTRVASLFYLVPGVTALLAWLLFSETLSPTQVTGMVIAAGGVAVATRAAKQKR